MAKADFKVALFDLDGVVLDTESQYSIFWGQMGREYRPDVPDFADRIKGQTLVQIYDGWFKGMNELQETITHRLNAFEAEMRFPYIKGARKCIMRMREAGIRTAVVTSSNKPKMQQAYREHPELLTLFDRILTSEDFSASKPAPDCYLLGARIFDVEPSMCIVFEDSINGLKAARASGAHVVGLTTTNPRSVVEPLSDEVIDDFENYFIEE